MSIIACGLNHKTAPLALREKFSIVPDSMHSCLQSLAQTQELEEAAILSTCNRTEFYCTSPRKEALLNWITSHYQCYQQEILPYVYVHEEAAAVKHILKVATGLDSMVLGEPQILGQMKDAFAKAQSVGTIGPSLNRLFQYIFSTSKEVRTSTGIGASPVSIAYAAVRLARQIFSDISNCNIMIVGAGETSELVLKYLNESRVKSVTVINRTIAKAHELASQYNGEAATFSEMAKVLEKVDIVISATNSAIPVIGKGTVERVFKRRKHCPIFMVDLAVPRDIEPEVAELPDIYLYCVDDLQNIIEKNLSNRSQAVAEAERLIELQVEHYINWVKSLDIVDTIKALRCKFESARDKEIKAAIHMLKQGTSPEEVCCHLGRNLTNKLLHCPTVKLREAGYNQNLEAIAFVKHLFGLEGV